MSRATGAASGRRARGGQRHPRHSGAPARDASARPAAGSRCCWCGESGVRELEVAPGEVRDHGRLARAGQGQQAARSSARTSRWRAEGCEGGPAALVVRLLGRAEDDGLLEVALWSPSGESVDASIRACGHVPLPPYIKREDEADDADRYQTVYARHDGAVAAPTAGLHITNALLGRLAVRGCDVASVTLHVGLGTFQPVTVDDLDQHPMHSEHYAVSQSTADAIARTRAPGSPGRGRRHDHRSRARERRRSRASRLRPGLQPARPASSSSPATTGAWSTGCSRTFTFRAPRCWPWSAPSAAPSACSTRIAGRWPSATASSPTATPCCSGGSTLRGPPTLRPRKRGSD